MSLTATCHCGAVHITLPAEAAGVLACHCGDCQKIESSRRAFCRTCGARVLKEVTPAGRWLISAGLIDGPTGKRFIRNLWEQSKPDWYDLPAVAP